jgi:hypothetical protein
MLLADVVNHFIFKDLGFFGARICVSTWQNSERFLSLSGNSLISIFW